MRLVGRRSFLLLVISLISLSICACDKSTSTTINNSNASSIMTTKRDYSHLYRGVSSSDTFSINETAYFKIDELSKIDYESLNLNPYQAEDINIEAIFTSPSNITYTRPAYLYQEYLLSLENKGLTSPDPSYFPDELMGNDTALKNGDPYFRFNIRPKELGEYTYRVEIRIKDELTQTFSAKFDVIDKDNYEEYLGKITIDETNNQYFKYENAGTYLPVGMNNAWYSSKNRKSYDYDVWFSHMRENGMNYSRIWLASWSFCLHMGTFAEIDNFDSRQNQLERLDRVLSLAEDNNIYISLCLLNHGQFSASTDAEWNNNPYNKIIEYPFLFFSDSECKRIYKNELRYIVGRYGDYDSIMTYELFNEVDWIDGFQPWALKVRDWHKEMASYINSIDAYDRLISTSYRTSAGLAYKLDEIDFVNIHDYSTSQAMNIQTKIKNEISGYLQRFDKPVMFEEWGVNSTSGKATYDIDSEGISLYQSFYASLLSGGASIPMNWWWDSYIHKYNLYPLFKGASRFSSLADYSGNITYLSKANISLDNDNLNFMGLKTSKDNFYAYVYDINYTRINNSDIVYDDVSIESDLNNGDYSLIIMNPMTGESIKEEDISIKDNKLVLNLNFTNDVLIILNKIKGE